MHFFNKLNLFKPSSSPRDAQSAREVGTDIPASKSNSASRSRRRLKRRSTKPVEAIRRQPQEPETSFGIQIPDHRNAGFRSAPDLLAEAHVGDSQSQSWSPIPSLQRKSAPADASIRFGETLSDGRSWKSYERKASSIDYLPNARPPLDEQLEDSPVFGPREEGLFREEMPYDMVSPLSELASGWRESPRYMSRTTPPDSPIRDRTHEQFPQHEMTHDTNSLHSKDSAAQWSYSPKSRPISPLRHTPEPVVDGTYYIVPGGTNVVFQDEDGNEITRVGDFTGRRRRISPIIVQDEFGRELYRTSDIQNSSRENTGSHRRGEPSRHRSRRTRLEEYETSHHSNPRSRSAELPHDEYSRLSDSGRSEPPTIILIDRGRQIPIMPHRSRRPSE